MHLGRFPRKASLASVFCPQQNRRPFLLPSIRDEIMVIALVPLLFLPILFFAGHLDAKVIALFVVCLLQFVIPSQNAVLLGWAQRRLSDSLPNSVPTVQALLLKLNRPILLDFLSSLKSRVEAFRPLIHFKLNRRMVDLRLGLGSWNHQQDCAWTWLLLAVLGFAMIPRLPCLLFKFRRWSQLRCLIGLLLLIACLWKLSAKLHEFGFKLPNANLFLLWCHKFAMGLAEKFRM